MKRYKVVSPKSDTHKVYQDKIGMKLNVPFSRPGVVYLKFEDNAIMIFNISDLQEVTHGTNN